MKTWIYARVSTQEQADRGFSIEAQVSSCLTYARANGLEMGDASNAGTPGVFVDGGQSATKKKNLADRPGGQAMLEAIQPGDAVVCMNPHRMFRNLLCSEVQLTRWREIGVVVHFVDLGIRTDTANGRMLLQVLSAMAEWKARIIGERVREANAWKKAGQAPKKERKSSSVQHDAPKNSLMAQAVLNSRRAPELPPFSGVVRAYIRVSTNHQSAETQRAIIENFCSADPTFCINQSVFYDDSGYSAYRIPFSKRPGGKELLKSIRPGDAVVCARADRLFRSMQDLISTAAEFAARGVRLILLDCNLRTDTPFGEMMFRLMGLIAEMESRDIGRAQAAGKQAKILKNQAVPPAEVPLWLKPKERTKRDPHPQLRTLLTDEEWRGYCWLVFHMIDNKHGYSPKKETDPAGARRTELADANIYGSVLWANKAYEQKLGWPHIYPHKSLPMRAAVIIRKTEEMQAKLGFSQRRQDLIDYLKTFPKSTPFRGSFICPRDAKQTLMSGWRIRKEMNRLKDETLGLLVAKGPKLLETQLQLVEG